MNSNIVNLQTKVASLDETLNGAESNPDSGLVAQVSALKETVGTFVSVPDKYSDIGSAITYLDNSVTAMDDRLRWHELAEN